MRQLVLLGGGECGKTTIFKQIQILYGTGFEQTSMDWIYAIHRAPVRAVKVVVQALKNRSDEYQLAEANIVRALVQLRGDTLTCCRRLPPHGWEA